MADAVEQALANEVKEAQAEFEKAEGSIQGDIEKAEAELEKARERRKRLITEAKLRTIQERDRLLRATKALRAYRGEPIGPGGKHMHLKEGKPEEEIIEKVLAAARDTVARSDDGAFTVTDIDRHQNMAGIGRTTVEAAITELRRREVVRRAGRGRRGVNKVVIYRFVEGSKS